MGSSHFKKISGTHGEYRLVEQISAGGMAEVYRAKLCGLEGFERTVAVKRILPEYSRDPLFVEMFLDEARIAARLSHPNIVQTIDLCLADGDYFIAMELVEGVDVRQLLKRCYTTGRPIPQRHGCRIVSEVCAALSYAYNKREAGRRMGVVHRDVSPPNVLVSTGGEVKLIDFGVAKAAQARRATTEDGLLTGKVGYFSPEQVRGLPADHRSDIFAAGVLLWELLTVRRLFRGPSSKAVLDAIQECRPPRPSKVNPAVPAQLDEIVARALARNPDDRYQDAGELHDRLCDFMELVGEQASASDLAAWSARVMADQTDVIDPPTLLAKRRPKRLPIRPRANRNVVRRVAAGTMPPSVEPRTPELPPVTVTFADHPGQVLVHFDSEPPGARVVVVTDGIGRKVGTTPVKVFLDPAVAHDVAMRKAGYASWTGRRMFGQRGTREVSVKLRRRPAAGRSSLSEETPA